jgi:uncharacterized protein (TIGR04222 family)
LCQIYVKPLETRRFLETAQRRTARTLVAWGMSVSIVGLGLYKLMTSFLTGGSDSLVLIPVMAVGLICTAINCRPVRLSDRGHRYLEQLSLEFGDWMRAVPQECRNHSEINAHLHRVDSLDSAAHRRMQVALFGSVSSHKGDRHEPATMSGPHLALDSGRVDLAVTRERKECCEAATMSG